MTTFNPISRRNALICLILSASLSIAWALAIDTSRHGGALGDFRAIYYGARTAINHHDPYKPDQFLQVYRQEGGNFPTEPDRLRSFSRAVPVCVNLPTTLLVVLPLALLSWVPAHFIWMALLPASLIIAAWLMWDLAETRAPGFILFLSCLLLANCENLLLLGNGSGMAMSLGAIAVWCFLKQRHEILGIVCFTLGLALKPQEIGLIWLFFLLAGGTYRKRAWQVAGAATVVATLSLLWVSQASPHWIEEWRANIAATSMRGDLNDPGPTSIGNQAVGMIVSLQSVISYFWDDPHIYNPVALLIGGALILIWCIVTVRSRPSREGALLAIASMAALSLLPIYHRQYDTKILLLTLPACALLWAQKSPLRKLATAITTVGIIFVSDIPVASMVMLRKSLNLPLDQFHGQLFSVLLGRTPTLALLLVGSFYLWAYAKYEVMDRAKASASAETEPELDMAALSA
ncbi:glycosyltransferase family 87 protein [Occallatibacter riparius]|uniref:DUF2029 domain-containing protein n=1 Tax=Occallatibacter riparius TaxID=1002689 RepID=A0A9J7BJK5_9BACT|nr:glycosyltransferase family 87 protein [Occallatibacter riparius]UWZ83084.1 DUF2029 domain-containing protein [Occallatibacter riparius]